MSLATRLENRIQGAVDLLKRPKGKVNMTWLMSENELLTQDPLPTFILADKEEYIACAISGMPDADLTVFVNGAVIVDDLKLDSNGENALKLDLRDGDVVKVITSLEGYKDAEVSETWVEPIPDFILKGISAILSGSDVTVIADVQDAEGRSVSVKLDVYLKDNYTVLLGSNTSPEPTVTIDAVEHELSENMKLFCQLSKNETVVKEIAVIELADVPYGTITSTTEEISVATTVAGVNLIVVDPVYSDPEDDYWATANSNKPNWGIGGSGCHDSYESSEGIEPAYIKYASDSRPNQGTTLQLTISCEGYNTVQTTALVNQA